MNKEKREELINRARIALLNSRGQDYDVLDNLIDEVIELYYSSKGFAEDAEQFMADHNFFRN